MLDPHRPIQFRAVGIAASAVLEPPVRGAAPSHDPVVVAAFAKAIVKPGRKALLLTWDNKPDRWCSIDEAVAMACAFCVEVDRDILAADSDKPELAEAVLGLADAIRFDGVTPVVAASGRPDHRHLLARIDDPGLHRRYAERAKALGLDVRRTIRPPLAPHRLGLRVELLDPIDPQVALAALAAPPMPRLSGRMQRLLRDGDREARYANRGERSTVLMALLDAMVNAGWSVEDAFRELWDRRNRGGEKIQGRPFAAARRYVEAHWPKAQKFVASRPAVRDRAAARSWIEAVRVAVELERWTGRTGASTRRIIAVHLDTATELGAVEYGLDVRTGAQRAGCTVGTWIDGGRRLRELGWLRLVERGRNGRADVWSLQIPEGAAGADDVAGGERQEGQPVPGRTRRVHHRTNPICPTPEEEGQDCSNPISPRGGDETDWCDVDSLTPAEDVWRRGALGGHAWLVWGRLHSTIPSSSRTIAEDIGLDQRAVRRYLRRLEEQGLAVHDDLWLWRRGPARLEDVAARLGTAGAGQAQRSTHGAERAEYRRYRARVPK